MSYSSEDDLYKIERVKGGRGYSVRAALSRTYIVKAQGYTGAHICLPKSVLGKRVKIVLVDEEESK